MNIWVIGASRGIGKSIAEELLRENHRVAVSARSREGLDALSVKAEDAEAVFRIPLDVSSFPQVETATRHIIDRFGSIDVLVNNAGVTRFKSVADTSVDEFNEIIDINLKGVVHGIKSVLPYMIENKKGWIINTISVTVNKVFTNSGAYAASKAGVLALTNVLREEVREHGIRVSAIIPGATKTDMWPAGVLKKYGDRMMQPDDVGKIVASVLRSPENVLVEEITVRPLLGDL